MKKTGQKTVAVPSGHMSLKRRILRNWELYLFLLPTIVLLLLFNYLPMFGIQIAFRNYKPYKGFIGSDWVGLKHFYTFLKMPKFLTLVKNTVSLSLYGLVAGFPLPIILAMALNLVPFKRFKRIVQTVSYAPHFISVVVMSGMVILMLSPTAGVINTIISMLGGEKINFMADAKLFPHIYVWSGIWQGVGWASIIYLSSLTGADAELYEAAKVDGANKFQRIIHLDIPTLLPTAVIMLIMNCGSIMSSNTQKILLLQNSLNVTTSEVIGTLVHKTGIMNMQYSYSSAVGLFQTIINIIMLVMVNKIASKISETSLW